MKCGHLSLAVYVPTVCVAAVAGLTSLLFSTTGSLGATGMRLVGVPSGEALPGTPAFRAASRPSVRCTRYAAPWGGDGSQGTKARPFRTPYRLAKSLRAGLTGCLRAGVYDDERNGYVLRIGRGGAPRAPITIRSYPGERAKLVGIVTVPKGSDHVRLDALTIEGTGEQNTIKIYAADVIVENSDISNASRGKSCMILGSGSGYGQAVWTVVRGNRFHDCGSVEHGNKDHAIYVSNSVNARIIRNVFWSTAAYSIHLYPNARGTQVAYNIIDGGEPSTRGGVLFGGDDDHASSDNVVERNVIAFAQTHNITSTWDGPVGSGNVARNNCLWDGRESNIDDSDGGFSADDNIVAPPLFVNRQKRDYRLRPDSRCVRVIASAGAD